MKFSEVEKLKKGNGIKFDGNKKLWIVSLITFHKTLEGVFRVDLIDKGNPDNGTFFTELQMEKALVVSSKADPEDDPQELPADEMVVEDPVDPEEAPVEVEPVFNPEDDKSAPVKEPEAPAKTPAKKSGSGKNK